MWHVSALYRPCIGHRTGYSLRQMPGFSGLASADFEGVFAHKLQAVPPPAFFYARDGAFSEGMKKDLGGTVLALSPRDFGRLIAEETGKWGKVIRASNIKAD